jgi:hypothetical protein
MERMLLQVTTESYLSVCEKPFSSQRIHGLVIKKTSDAGSIILLHLGNIKILHLVFSLCF